MSEIGIYRQLTICVMKEPTITEPKSQFVLQQGNR
jgi:hypothetical protein